VEIPAGAILEYKYVLLEGDGLRSIAWQSGNNSVLAVGHSDGNVEVRFSTLGLNFPTLNTFFLWQLKQPLSITESTEAVATVKVKLYRQQSACDGPLCRQCGAEAFMH